MKLAKERLPLTMMIEVKTILVRLKNIIIGIESIAPIILFLMVIPTEERIAETNRQASRMPEQRKERIIGSFRLETRIVEVFVVVSNTNKLFIPKKESKALDKNP